MKRRIPRAGLVTALLLAMGGTAHAQAQQDAQLSQQAEVAAAANLDLAHFAQHAIEKGDSALAGGFPLNIQHVNELKSAKLGLGFPVYTIDPRRLTGGENDLSSMAVPTGSWRFMIVEGSKPIGMATVDKVDGHWQTVAYGAAALSQEVNANLTTHANTVDTHFRFIRVYQAQSDLLEFSSPGARHPRYALMQSARHTLFPQREVETTVAVHAAPLMNQEDFIEPLRSAARANMSSAR